MKVSKVRYGRTVVMEGKFQSWRAEAEVELEEGDTIDAAKAEAKRVVMFVLQEAIDKGAK
jgi:hypothetical protein